MSYTVHIPGGARVIELVTWYGNDANVLAAFPTEPGQGVRDIRTTFTLVPEHGNRHDPHAVRVYAGDRWITYVARENAAGLHRELVKIEAEGGVAEFDGIMRIARDHDGDVQWRAAVSLPKLAEIYPLARARRRVEKQEKSVKERPPKQRTPKPAKGPKVKPPRRPVPAPSFERLVWITVASVMLGWLGVDRFLNRQPALGLVKLLTVGGLGFWWLADVVYFAVRAVRVKLQRQDMGDTRRGEESQEPEDWA